MRFALRPGSGQLRPGPEQLLPGPKIPLKINKLPPMQISCLGAQAEMNQPEDEMLQPQVGAFPGPRIQLQPASNLRTKCSNLRSELFPAPEFNSDLLPTWQLRPGLMQPPTWTQAAAWRWEEISSPPPLFILILVLILEFRFCCVSNQIMLQLDVLCSLI